MVLSGLAMAGKTVTRADLCEAVYQKVGLSRTESAALVELVLKEITDCLERGGKVEVSSFGLFVVRKKGERVGRTPKAGKGGPDLAGAGHGVQAVRHSQAADQHRSRRGMTIARDRRLVVRVGVNGVDKAPDAFRTISEVAEELNLPQHVLRFWETRFSQIR